MSYAIEHLHISAGWSRVKKYWRFMLEEYQDDCWQCIYVSYLQVGADGSRDAYYRRLGSNMERLAREMGYTRKAYANQPGDRTWKKLEHQFRPRRKRPKA